LKTFARPQPKKMPHLFHPQYTPLFLWWEVVGGNWVDIQLKDAGSIYFLIGKINAMQWNEARRDDTGYGKCGGEKRDMGYGTWFIWLIWDLRQCQIGIRWWWDGIVSHATYSTGDSDSDWGWFGLVSVLVLGAARRQRHFVALLLLFCNS